MVDGSLTDEFASRLDLFRPELTRAARQWFIDQLVSYVRTQKPPDERAAVLQRLKDAKALAQRCVDTLARYAKRADAGVTVLALAPVAAYGAIGLHPDVFLDGDNSDLLEFVAVRRRSAVDRMRWDVSKDLIYPGQVIQPGDLLEQAPSMHATGQIEIGHLDRSFEPGSRFISAGRPEFHIVTNTGPLDSQFEQIFVPMPWDQLEIGDHKPKVRVRGMDVAGRIEAAGTRVSVFCSEFGA